MLDSQGHRWKNLSGKSFLDVQFVCNQVAYPNLQQRDPDLSELTPPCLPCFTAAELLAAIVLLITLQEILKRFEHDSRQGDSMPALKIKNEKSPLNNGWTGAESFEPGDHFSLLTLLCAR